MIDAFVQGAGRLTVQLYGLITVANAAGAGIDRGEALRYLAELPWAPDAILGRCMDFDADGSFSYIIGAEVTATERTPDDMVMRTIPAGRYAVFTAHGKMPDAIQQTTRSIYSEWLPNSPYRHAGFADYELYDARFEDPDDPLIEIYVSIVET